MASKTFKTSAAPTNKMKGGLDAISSGGLYAVQSGKGRRQHKKRKAALNTAGGKEVTKNQWHKRTSIVKGVDHKGKAYTHTVVLWGATTLRDTNDAVYETNVSGKKVTLFDESTYSPSMLINKGEKEVKNPAPEKGTHKTHSRSAGYMESHRTNGRRVMRTTANVIN